LPSELVDFMLAAYLEDPDDGDDPFGSHSDHVIEELGIGDHFQFYPASPAQPPFLALLRLHEQQALRLIRGFCNHSISIWRKAKERGRRYAEPLTPIPLTLTFPLGAQTFWGDAQVYLWFRGTWGNAAVKSALMALEQWALEQLDKGATFDDIFRKVIEGNDSVAALGIGVSLCLARPGTSLQCAFPLVTCPYLWEWDIARLVQDSTTPPNEMGDWYRYRLLLTAVRALNQKPHRKHHIENLVPYFVFSDDAVLKDTFTESVRSFADRLPLSYEEEKAHPEHIAAVREKMIVFAEKADPQFWRAAPTEDGKHIQLWNEPPTLQQEQYKAQRERHVQLNDYLAVAMWANKSLESGSVDDKFSLQDALAKVRSWDRPDLFDVRTEAFEERYRASAVVGAAYVVARHRPPEVWTDELGAWCLNVIERAATGPENLGEVNVRSAVLLMHPAVIAAHGYSALLARGYAIEQCQSGLLNLAIDALQAVQISVFASAKHYAAVQPHFYWVLLGVGLEQCIEQRDDIPDYHSTAWDQRESDRKIALLDRAEAYLRSGGMPPLPAIPMPWMKVGKESQREWRDTKGYARNDAVFLYDLAGKIIPEICLEPILDDANRRSQFLSLVSGLLEYTFQEIVPPFAKSKRDYHGNTSFEWVFDFSAWCGKLCAYLMYNEAKNILVSIWAKDEETALLMLQSVMRVFMIRAFLRPADVSDEHLALWSEMIDWLFATPEWEGNRREDHIDREFTYCAFAALFCVVQDFSPLVCGVDPGWPHLKKFLPIIKRAIREFGENVTLYLAVTTFLKRGGMDLMPEPALAWLLSVVESRKGDQEFWGPNGENTVELLKLLISQKGSMLLPEHRKSIILIADILIDNGVRGAGFLQQELLRAA
jgi:hypothetical protein